MFMTQKELATLCGCTQATVSKALRGVTTISEDMREKILTAAKEHGVSHEPTGTVSGDTVLVITPEYKSEHYTNIMSLLSRSLWEHGFKVLTATYEFDTSKLNHLPKLARSIRGLCGIIDLISIHYDALDTLIRIGIPVVKSSKHSQIDHVALLKYDSIRKAITHLVENGRRRIAFAGEMNTLVKEFPFRQIMAELGLPLDNRYIHRSALRFAQAGADGFEKLMGLDEPPDAIICAYDYIAFGVLNAAHAARINVPHDLAVIGMDNISSTGVYQLGLTTLSLDYRKLSDTLVELLIRRIRKPDAPVQQISMEYELIVRETG